MIYAITVTIGIEEESAEAALAAMHDVIGSLDGVGIVKWWTVDDEPQRVLSIDPIGRPL